MNRNQNRVLRQLHDELQIEAAHIMTCATLQEREKHFVQILRIGREIHDLMSNIERFSLKPVEDIEHEDTVG